MAQPRGRGQGAPQPGSSATWRGRDAAIGHEAAPGDGSQPVRPSSAGPAGAARPLPASCTSAPTRCSGRDAPLARSSVSSVMRTRARVVGVRRSGDRAPAPSARGPRPADHRRAAVLAQLHRGRIAHRRSQRPWQRHRCLRSAPSPMCPDCTPPMHCRLGPAARSSAGRAPRAEVTSALSQARGPLLQSRWPPRAPSVREKQQGAHEGRLARTTNARLRPASPRHQRRARPRAWPRRRPPPRARARAPPRRWAPRSP